MKQKTIAAALLLAVLASGCAKKPEVFTVTFRHGDTVLQQQTLEEGSALPQYLPDPVPGLRFIAWETTNNPESKDVTMDAVFVPALTIHAPYLFPMEDGLLHPEDPFTGEMLAQALDALGDADAKKHYPTMPTGALTLADFRNTMEAFFPENASALSGDDAAPLSRAEAAKLLNALLGRTESVQIPKDTMGFADVSPKEDWFADLMEASIPHEAGNTLWKDAALPTGFAPGWERKEGRLRFFDEDGRLVRNTTLPTGHTMDAAGYFTSGDAELDELVIPILASFQEEDPEADPMALLRKVYDYCRDKFMYLNREYYDMGAEGWQIEDAKIMLSTGKGNCYKYTSAFWALSRGLGFQTRAVSGLINVHPHAWAIITMDGLEYYCDPELEMSHRAEGEYDWDLFMREKSTMRNWEYTEPAPAEGDSAQ